MWTRPQVSSTSDSLCCELEPHLRAAPLPTSQDTDPAVPTWVARPGTAELSVLPCWSDSWAPLSGPFPADHLQGLWLPSSLWELCPQCIPVPQGGLLGALKALARQHLKESGFVRTLSCSKGLSEGTLHPRSEPLVYLVPEPTHKGPFIRMLS